MSEDKKSHGGAIPAEREITLSEEYAEIWSEFCDGIEGHYDRARTETTRRQGSRYWLKWCAGRGLDPLEAEQEWVHSYVDDMKSNLADNTIASRFSSVSEFYRWLNRRVEYDWEGIPTEGIDLREDHNIKTNTPLYYQVLEERGDEDLVALPKETITTVWEYPGGSGSTSIRNELIIRLAWATAMRMDELSRVRLDNIDFGERDIEIRSAKLNPDDHPELYRRHVYYPRTLDPLMRRWVDEYRREHSKYAVDSPYLFLTTHNEQMRPSHMSRIIKESARRADVQEVMVEEDGNGNARHLVTGHRIRHSSISHWANNLDIDLLSIKRMAGHAKFDTTLSYVSTDWDTVKQDYRTYIG